MSQIIKTLTSGGPIPPEIPTTFTTHSGSATPAANNLNVFTSSTGETSNNTKGITTSASGSTVSTILTNRVQGQANTSDATPTTLYTFSMGATAGTYLFFTRVVAFNTTDNTSSGYASYRCVRTTGAAGTLISAQSGLTAEEDATMNAASAVNSISGNDALLTVTGVAGKTIRWYALTEFTFIGAS